MWAAVDNRRGRVVLERFARSGSDAAPAPPEVFAGDDLPPLSEEEKAAERAAEAEAKAKADAALAEVAASQAEAANGAGDAAAPPPAGTTPPRPA